MENLQYTALITLLILIQYFWLAIMVGKARGKTGISAPSTLGDPTFERTFRVHQNTLEQLIILLPSLWLFGHYIDDQIGALLGLVFLVGRILYARSYVRNPAQRSLGFTIGMFATLALLLGGLVGVVLELIPTAA